MIREAGLSSANGKLIALQSVHVEGRLDEVLAIMTVTQRYRNDSGEKLEIVHTFPLASGAVPLGLTANVGNKRLNAAVVARDEARERYENAIADGDAPVLVEQSAPGLYTANLGGIESGEEVTVELRYAQLPHREGGSLRLAIPCAIAPRYGNQHRDGGLSPHENADADILAEYPLTVRILLCGNLTGATVECPSHSCHTKSTEDGTVVTFSPGALADRDVILAISGLERRSFALAGPDIDGRSLVLAGFRPALPQTETKPLCLKILADCSGSMAGDSIRNLKEGLFGLLGMLEREDHISYSRFGTAVRHETEGVMPCSMDTIGQLAKAFDQTEADLGGADLERALLAACNDSSLPPDDHAAPCVLLITGGHVWKTENVLRAARASGQRLFAIGVGSAPAESLLRRLAAETGGACAFVSGNEDMVLAIRRMVGKMRGATDGSLRVDWGRDAVWQSSLPLNVYDGDSVYAFASFAEPPQAACAAVPFLRWHSGGEEYRLHAEEPDTAWDGAITRLAGAERLAMAESSEKARDLALRRQLVSGHTALLLVQERKGEKSAGLPVPHQVPQMMAAGHGGFGFVPRFLK